MIRLAKPQRWKATQIARTQRIALFRSLFRGREDVFGWWQTADGKAGYSPSVLKNWKAINQSRPEDRKKVDRETRIFLPLTNAVIEETPVGKGDGRYLSAATINVLVPGRRF